MTKCKYQASPSGAAYSRNLSKPAGHASCACNVKALDASEDLSPTQFILSGRASSLSDLMSMVSTANANEENKKSASSPESFILKSSAMFGAL